MITIYTTPSCSSCRKAKKWLDEHRITYYEKNIFHEKLTKEDLLKILECSENGFNDIISTRSKVIKEQDLILDNLTIDKAMEFILSNPSILKRPIIIEDDKMQVGYNEEEIRIFIPKDLRRAIMYGPTSHTEDEYKAVINRYYQELEDKKKKQVKTLKKVEF